MDQIQFFQQLLQQEVAEVEVDQMQVLLLMVILEEAVVVVNQAVLLVQ
jgi:hypothetical protein